MRDRRQLIADFTTAWQARDVEALMGLMAPDPTFRASVGPEPGTTYAGHEQVRAGFEAFLGGPPPTGPAPVTEEEEMLVCAEFAVTRWVTRSPDGAGGETVVHACDIFRFEGDRIALKDTYRKLLAT